MREDAGNDASPMKDDNQGHEGEEHGKQEDEGRFPESNAELDLGWAVVRIRRVCSTTPADVCQYLSSHEQPKSAEPMSNIRSRPVNCARVRASLAFVSAMALRDVGQGSGKLHWAAASQVVMRQTA